MTSNRFTFEELQAADNRSVVTVALFYIGVASG
jgi:hypothetical protein